MLCYLADFATPLHAAIHTVPFQWTAWEDDIYRSLKVMLSHAPVIQPPDWTRPFHVFVDASNIAIGSAFLRALFNIVSVFSDLCILSTGLMSLIIHSLYMTV